MSSPHRYLPGRPFPPYTYVPGQEPHPIRDPQGHMHGEEPTVVELVDDWRQSEEYLWGIDLFNHGYYWEAHEAWEGLWHAAGRTGPLADFFKGLIKLAAAGVKTREGSTIGRWRHLNRAIELLEGVPQKIVESQIGVKLDDVRCELENADLMNSPANARAGEPPRVFKMFLAA